MAEGLLTTEQTTQTKLCALQENEAMDTQWLLDKKSGFCSTLSLKMLKKWVSLTEIIWIILLKDLFNKHLQEQAAASALGIEILSSTVSLFHSTFTKGRKMLDEIERA